MGYQQLSGPAWRCLESDGDLGMLQKASGASEEAPAPAAAPALSKKGKKGQLGMKEAAGLRDPFSAPSPPVPAPAPTPAPAKASEPEPAAAAAAAPAEPKVLILWKSHRVMSACCGLA